MDFNRIRDHVFSSYVSLRLGIAIIAIVLPVLLLLIGILLEEPMRESMSAYYHMSSETRDVFVGILCAIGVFLHLYKGFSNLENYLLNAAGIFAVMVAVFPMDACKVNVCDAAAVAASAQGVDVLGLHLTLHGASAVLFFISIAAVCVFCAHSTLHFMENQPRESLYRLIYRILGGLMIALPVGIFLFFQKSNTFFAEAAGVWVFSGYWIVKTLELKETRADRIALDESADLARFAPPVASSENEAAPPAP